MPNNHNGNWLFDIIRIKLPLIFWGVFLVGVIVTSLIFFLPPIYKATTILTLDSDAERVLRELELSYPAATMNDYIRYEYFAIHNVTLMRSPDLAKKIVSDFQIKTSSGKMIFPENLVAPGLFTLLFKNNGQGIKVDWIADTQQFGITGYSMAPARAVAFSKGYTEAFLKKNAGQFSGMIQVLTTRLKSQLETSTERIGELEGKIREIKLKHDIFEASVESEKLTARVLEIGKRLSSITLAEETYRKRMEHLTSEAKYHEKLLTYQRIIRTNPLIDELKSKVVNLSGSLSALSVEYTPTHPEYLSIKKNLDNAKKALSNEAQKYFYQETREISTVRDQILSSILELALEHQIAESEIKHLESQQNTYQERINELTQAQSDLNLLNQELVTYNNLKNGAQTKLVIISNIANYPLPFFRVVSNARINGDNLKYYKYFPRRKTILLVSLVLSVMVFLFLVIAREMCMDLFYYSRHLSGGNYDFGIAEIPTIPNSEMMGPQCESVVCGYMRDVLMQFVDAKLIRIISELKNEGKATIGQSLAWYLSRLNKSVILVDGDNVHRSCSRALGMGTRPGLTDFLLGKMDINSVVVQDPELNISFIPAGAGSVSMGSRGRGKSSAEMISTLSTRYDTIIFLDTPLCNTLFPSVENVDHDVIIVLKSGEHSISKVKEIIQMGGRTSGGHSAKIVGMVLNKLPFAADVLTLGGICKLVSQLIKQPFYLKRPK